MLFIIKNIYFCSAKSSNYEQKAWSNVLNLCLQYRETVMRDQVRLYDQWLNRVGFEHDDVRIWYLKMPNEMRNIWNLINLGVLLPKTSIKFRDDHWSSLHCRMMSIHWDAKYEWCIFQWPYADNMFVCPCTFDDSVVLIFTECLDLPGHDRDFSNEISKP